MELTRGHMKRDKSGNRTPWQLLSAAGDRCAPALFREYARIFKGTRQVTYSRGFKDASDDELVGPIVCHESPNGCAEGAAGWCGRSTNGRVALIPSGWGGGVTGKIKGESARG